MPKPSDNDCRLYNVAALLGLAEQKTTSFMREKIEDKAVEKINEKVEATSFLNKLWLTSMAAAGKNKMPQIKLGELLIMAEILTEDELTRALWLSKKMKKGLGRTLVEMEVFPRTFLSTALQMQRSVNSGNLKASTAAETLAYIARLDKYRGFRESNYKFSMEVAGVPGQDLPAGKIAQKLLSSASSIGHLLR